MKYITILFILFFSLTLNGTFIFTKIKEEQKQKQEQNKELFNEKLFSSWMKLRDYSGVKYTLEEEGKKIIKNIREFHSSPALIKWEWYNMYLCAWFLFELTTILWWDDAPYIIGMMDQKSKKPADAWELPDSYTYVGWKIEADFSKKFSLDTKDFWTVFDYRELENFFNTAFTEKVLLWDIGFLFKDTDFISELKVKENYNSHIAKNMGISTFIKTLDFETENKTNEDIFKEAFSCDTDIYNKIKNLLSHYEIYYNDKRIVYTKWSFYYLGNSNEVWDEVIFEKLWEISMKDITLVHFFQWAKVNSLFEMTCEGEFYPINIMSVNPRFIEKM